MEVIIISILTFIIILRINSELSLRNYFNLFLEMEINLTTEIISYIYSFGQLLSIPSAFIAPFLMERFGEEKVFNIATIVVGISVILIGYSNFFHEVFILFPLALFFAQIARPALIVITMKYLTQNWQATMSGANMVVIGISGFLGAYLGGIIIEPYGFHIYF